MNGSLRPTRPGRSDAFFFTLLIGIVVPWTLGMIRFVEWLIAMFSG